MTFLPSSASQRASREWCSSPSSSLPLNLACINTDSICSTKSFATASFSSKCRVVTTKDAAYPLSSEGEQWGLTKSLPHSSRFPLTQGSWKVQELLQTDNLMIIYNRTTSSDRDSIINYVTVITFFFFSLSLQPVKWLSGNKTIPYHQQQKLCGSPRSLLEHPTPDPSLILQAPDHKTLGSR